MSTLERAQVGALGIMGASTTYPTGLIYERFGSKAVYALSTGLVGGSTALFSLVQLIIL